MLILTFVVLFLTGLLLLGGKYLSSRPQVAYYCTAVGYGWLLMTILSLARSDFVLGHGWRSVRGILGFYLVSLFVGWFPALLFGFLLRKLTKALDWKGRFQWVGVGVGLAPLMSWSVYGTLLALRLLTDRLSPLAANILLAPIALLLVGLIPPGLLSSGSKAEWTAILMLVGGATGLVLHEMQRACRSDVFPL